MSYNESDEAVVYCYDTSQDEWSTLPPLSVVRFGLGQLGEKLVTVGGRRISDGKPTKEVFTFDEKTRRWKQSIPSLPTARVVPSVLGHQPLLVVAGGTYPPEVLADRVEVFNVYTTQWTLSHSLPVPCHNASVAKSSPGTYYLVGGYRGTSPLMQTSLNQITSVSIDQLLQNMLQLNLVTLDELNSPFSTAPSTPTYEPTTATLFDSLLAIGGANSREESQDKVFMLCDGSWAEVATLPTAKRQAASATLSDTEVLVIGGCEKDGGKTRTVYKGILEVLSS